MDSWKQPGAARLYRVEEGLQQETGVRRVHLPAPGPLVRVGAIPNRISVERAEWIMDHLRERGLPFRFASVPVAGYDRHSVYNKDDYYSSGEQIDRLIEALQQGNIEMAVLPLTEFPELPPKQVRLAAVTDSVEPAYCLVRPLGCELRPGDTIGVYNFSLARQLRAEKSSFHYEQRMYSFSQALSFLEEGRWRGVVLPLCDMIYSGQMEEWEVERLDPSRIVPPPGQGALALLTLTEQVELAGSLLSSVHSTLREKAYRLEQELADLLRANLEHPGVCIWQSGSEYKLSLYNPHLLRPFQRWATRVVGSTSTGLDKRRCYSLIQQVLGRLTILGIGPGSPGYLTAEGEKILRRTEFLLCRSSRADQLYYLLDPKCEILDLENDPSLQDDNDVLVRITDALRKGLRTTLLVSGDGYLYSYGTGIARLLAEQRVPFLFSPGLSLPIAGANRAGVPLMLPGMAPSAHFFDGRDPLLPEYEFKGLPGTIIFSTSPAQLPGLVQLLIGPKKLPELLPALALSNPGSPDQESRVGTLIQFAEEASLFPDDMQAQCLLILGPVVRLHELLDARKHRTRPLSEQTILMPLVRELEDHERRYKADWEEQGAHVVLLRLSSVILTDECRRQLQSLFRSIVTGTLRLPAVVRPGASERERQKEQKKRVNQALEGRTWLIFLTPEAVQTFFSEYRNQGHDLRQLSGCGIASASDPVFRALGEQGIQPDFTVSDQENEGLAVGMKRFLTPQDQVVLLRGQSNPTLTEMMFHVSKIPCLGVGIYEQQVRLPSAQQLLRMFDESDYIALLSPSTATAFAQAMALADLGHDALTSRPIKLLASRPRVRETLESHGFQVAGDFSLLDDV